MQKLLLHGSFWQPRPYNEKGGNAQMSTQSMHKTEQNVKTLQRPNVKTLKNLGPNGHKALKQCSRTTLRNHSIPLE